MPACSSRGASTSFTSGSLYETPGGSLTYQPGGRYWPFQWNELAIFVALALILVGLSFWWVRRRVS